MIFFKDLDDQLMIYQWYGFLETQNWSTMSKQ